MGKPTVDIIIPVYNEEDALEGSIATLRAFLAEHGGGYEWRIAVADNASTDQTFPIAQRLSETWPEVRVIHLDEKGRGRALKQAWLGSEADIVCYMDVDLSTNLNSLPPLIDAIRDGADAAIGTRLAKASRVTRSTKREIISRCYNFGVKLLFFTRFSDAQCGFKAIRTSVARRVLPLIHNTYWFFDSELLIVLEKSGMKIAEIPVNWIEDYGTTVRIVRDVIAFARELLGLRWRLGRTVAEVKQTQSD